MKESSGRRQGAQRHLATLPRPLHAQRPRPRQPPGSPRRLRFIATAFAQDDAEAARQQWRKVADQLRPKVPKLAKLMDEAEADVLADMAFLKDHRPKIHSTNPLARVNGEIKRRTEVVGIFPNKDAIIRLVGAILLEQNDEWAVQRARYMTLETIAMIPRHPARCGRLTNPAHGDHADQLHHVTGHDPGARPSPARSSFNGA